jgi:hypothetical protein
MAREPNHKSLTNAAHGEAKPGPPASVPIGLLADDTTEEQVMFLGSSRVSGRSRRRAPASRAGA